MEKEERPREVYLNTDDQFVHDVSVQFLYKRHTVLALAVVVSGLVYMAFAWPSETDTIENIKRGVWSAVFFLLVLGLLVFPTGPFIRPHPLVWRLSFGIGVVYQLYLIVLLFQTKEDARRSLTLFYPYLNKPLEEREYAADCRLTWENLKNGIFDIYFVGHFVGWVLKTMMIRDRLICWIISIQWELIEVAFTHMLPNFAECWWDSWVLDVLVTNGLGIYVGHKLCVYFEMKKYKWSGLRDYPTVGGKLKRLALQFTPESWMRVEWDPLRNVKRFLWIQAVIILIHLEELNAFFLKHLLWIPPPCPLNHIRLGIWFFVGLPCLRQLYIYITNPECKRIGTHSFLCLCLISTELLIIFKFSPGEFPKPMPTNIKMLVWTCCIIYLVGFAAIFTHIRRREFRELEAVQNEIYARAAVKSGAGAGSAEEAKTSASAASAEDAKKRN